MGDARTTNMALRARAADRNLRGEVDVGGRSKGILNDSAGHKVHAAVAATECAPQVTSNRVWGYQGHNNR